MRGHDAGAAKHVRQPRINRGSCMAGGYTSRAGRIELPSQIKSIGNDEAPSAHPAAPKHSAAAIGGCGPLSPRAQD
ncbi:unnamed protein product [Urochloa humidicola]